MQGASLRTLTAQDPAPLRSRPCRSGEANLSYVARRAGLLDFEPRAIIAKLRLLATRSGFPLPKTPRFVKGVRVTGPDCIHAYSIWDKDAVDQWFDDDRPPAESAALGFARRNAAAEEMARRAQGLVLVASNG